MVLTGPPGAGKSTSIERLARGGVSTMPEMSRRLIEEEQGRAGDVYPWTRLSDFVSRLWPAQVRQFEMAARLSTPVLFDRGIPDALAFLGFHGVRAPATYLDACHRWRYDLVLDLDLVPGYVCDSQRPYEEEEARVLLRLNQEAYRSLGYELTRIPVLAIQARTDFILEKVNEQWR